eukprot:2349043-Rhodomonas_salina.1
MARCFPSVLALPVFKLDYTSEAHPGHQEAGLECGAAIEEQRPTSSKGQGGIFKRARQSVPEGLCWLKFCSELEHIWQAWNLRGQKQSAKDFVCPHEPEGPSVKGVAGVWARSGAVNQVQTESSDPLNPVPGQEIPGPLKSQKNCAGKLECQLLTKH